MPPLGTPKELVEAWLAFHEDDLCQTVDALFVFHGNRTEVWSVVKDEKDHRKLQELFKPLRDVYRIEHYTTWMPEEDKSDNEESPPPSLWENSELRDYLGDPGISHADRIGFGIIVSTDPFPVGYLLKQRLLIFANNILEWNRKMERYATDLPALAAVAHNPTIASETRRRASLLCLEHAQKLDENIKKLDENLSHAFPKPERKDSRFQQPDEFMFNGKTSVDFAIQLADKAHSVARRVHQFIYPERYTVELNELRDPELLISLKALRRMNAEFLRSVGRWTRDEG